MHFSKEIMKGAADVVVLQALSASKAYGYELVSRIERTSNGIFELQEGTIYPLLYRLEDRGDVVSHKQVTPQGKERRYYEITSQGKKQLQKSVKEYKQFITGLQHVLNLSYAKI